MRHLFSILFIGLLPCSLFCQTIFTGANSNYWTDAGNWIKELPAVGNDGSISVGLTAYNDEFFENSGTFDNREKPDIALVDDRYTTFSTDRVFWGIDIGLKVGYRMQFIDDEYGDNYSGISGGLEARYRFGL
jgi:hypothetical protein